MKVLIGYDGSKHSDRALAGLAQAGLPADTEALVATVATPWPDVNPEILMEASLGLPAATLAKRALEEAQGLAAKAARRLERLFPTWRIRSEAAAGRPAQVLLEKAEAWKPDLVVVGSHGRGRLRRLALGSVSFRVLQHAKTGVRITPIRFVPGRAAALRILLAMDGSAGADRARAELESRNWPPGTRVRVVAVVDWREAPSELLRSGYADFERKTRSALRTRIEAEVEEVSGILSRKGLAASHDVLLGDPRHVILKVAKAWKADAIFIGSRGLDAIDRFLLGSISFAVASHAPCTVEVVRGIRDSRGGEKG